MGSLVPFLIMGRVTYIHHYVRGFLDHFYSHTLMTCHFLAAPNSLLLRPNGRTSPRPFCLQVSTTQGANKMDCVRVVRRRDRRHILVVPWCRMGNRRPDQGALGSPVAEGAPSITVPLLFRCV